MGNRYVVRVRESTEEPDPKIIDTQIADSEPDVKAIMQDFMKRFGHLADQAIIEVEEVY
nr:hypothetical protein [uncultured Anaeromusa sp.]